jgi:hypothetical protein
MSAQEGVLEVIIPGVGWVAIAVHGGDVRVCANYESADTEAPPVFDEEVLTWSRVVSPRVPKVIWLVQMTGFSGGWEKWRVHTAQEAAERYMASWGLKPPLNGWWTYYEEVTARVEGSPDTTECRVHVPYTTEPGTCPVSATGKHVWSPQVPKELEAGVTVQICACGLRHERKLAAACNKCEMMLPVERYVWDPARKGGE